MQFSIQLFRNSLLLSVLLLVFSFSAQAQERDIQEELYQRALVHPALDAVFASHPLDNEARKFQGETDYIPLNKVFILKNELIGFNFELVKFEELCEVVTWSSIAEHRIEHFVEFIGFELLENQTFGAVTLAYRYPELYQYNSHALYASFYFRKDENGIWQSTDHYLYNNLYSLSFTGTGE